jgi:hypothetical protein
MAKPRRGMDSHAPSGVASQMKIQVYLTAAAINLKRLAATLLALLLHWIPPGSPFPRSHPRAGLEARATGLIAAYTTGTDHFFNDPTTHLCQAASGKGQRSERFRFWNFAPIFGFDTDLGLTQIKPSFR